MSRVALFLLVSVAALAGPSASAARAAGGAATAAAAAAAPAPAAAADGGPSIPFEKYTLPNGLTVLLHQDHRVPTVHVELWYKVGSKDETPGRTGFAHLFEHIMFQGTKHVPEDKHFAFLQEAGASGINGSTNNDRTNYFETVPSNQLELALWLESERMGFLLERPSFKATLDNQREVVKNERRQRVENVPMGAVGKVRLEALYPPSHPYHHEVIGSMDDLDAASEADVKGFFTQWYAPSNAILAIGGDIDPARARALVERYFGPIPAGPALVRPPVPPTALARETRIAMEAKVKMPSETITWHSVPNFQDGDAELDILGGVLGGGKSSRLHRRLVLEMKIAQSVSANEGGQLLAGTFGISFTPMPGHTLAEIEKVVDEEVARIRKEPPAQHEIDRVRNQIEAGQWRGLESVTGRVSRLLSYEYYKGDPGWLGKDRERYRAVDPEGVRRWAERVLKPDARLVVTVAPNPEAPIMGRLVAAAAGKGASTAGASAAGKGASTAGASAAGKGASTAGAMAGAGKTATPTTTAASATAAPAGKAAAPPTAATATAVAGGKAAPARPAALAVAPRPTPDADFRAHKPGPGPEPSFKVPAVKRFKLKNGLEVVLAESHDLPLVSFALDVKTAGEANPKGLAGLADLTANMLDEGTKTRSALQIADETSFMGATLGTGAGWDASSVSTSTLTRNLDKALDVWADVLLHPAFDEKELARVRDNVLTGLARRKDSPTAVAGIAYNRVLYGDGHPYGWPQNGTDDSVKKIGVADVRRFWDTYYRPNNAVLAVAGDITMPALKAKLAVLLKDWKAKKVPAVKLAAAKDGSKTIYLVDKAGAPQSSIRVGLVGMPRKAADHVPATVMNLILGGGFHRLGLNLREAKGWTYGVTSSFDMRKDAGPWTTAGEFVAKHTAESVSEILKEIDGMRDADVGDDELRESKEQIVKAFPARFATDGQIASQMASLSIYGLPLDTWDTYTKEVAAVSKADVRRMAQKYLRPGNLAIVVVGDRASHEKALAAIAPVELRDLDGHTVTAGGGAPTPAASDADTGAR